MTSITNLTPVGIIGDSGNIVFIVEMQDAITHTDEHPLCSDISCPCHQDELAARRQARTRERALAKARRESAAQLALLDAQIGKHISSEMSGK